MALLQPRSVLMSSAPVTMAYITTKGHADAKSGLPPEAMLSSRGHVATRVMFISVACTAIWSLGDIQAWQLPRTSSRSMVLLQPSLCWNSVASTATKGQTDAQGLGHNL